jgi:hypothetical protein
MKKITNGPSPKVSAKERINPINPAIFCSLPGCGCRRNSFVHVSHKRKLIYYEVPKCASVSIKSSLSIQLNGNLGLSDEGLDFEMYMGSPKNAQDKYGGYKQFSVIRNPVERVVSCYNMFCYGRKHRVEQMKTMFGFVPNSIDIFLAHAQIYPNHHWNPISTFLPPDLSDLVVLDIANTDKINGFLSAYGFPPLSKLNASSRQSEKEFDVVLESGFCEHDSHFSVLLGG